MKNNPTYKVLLKHNPTGEERLLTLSDWNKGTLFNWFENNYSCDCNRRLEFYRSKGLELGVIDSTCSEEEYSVVYIEDPEGNYVTEDNYEKV